MPCLAEGRRVSLQMQCLDASKERLHRYCGRCPNGPRVHTGPLCFFFGPSSDLFTGQSCVRRDSFQQDRVRLAEL